MLAPGNTYVVDMEETTVPCPGTGAEYYPPVADGYVDPNGRWTLTARVLNRYMVPYCTSSVSSGVHETLAVTYVRWYGYAAPSNA